MPEKFFFTGQTHNINNQWPDKANSMGGGNMDETRESNAGRPTEYADEFCQKANELCQAGATDSEIADFFGVSTRTIYRWKLEYPEFCQAIAAGKEIADERVERSLYQNATGFAYKEQQAIKIKVDQHQEEIKVVEVERYAPAETTAASLWLRNRRPEKWRDKQDLNIGGQKGNPVETKTTVEFIRAKPQDS